MLLSSADRPECWPSLPLDSWKDTCATLHMWTQIVGKVRMALSPPVNHWWHVTLYVTARGLTTSPIPYGTRTFEVSLDASISLLPDLPAGAIKVADGK